MGRRFYRGRLLVSGGPPRYDAGFAGGVSLGIQRGLSRFRYPSQRRADPGPGNGRLLGRRQGPAHHRRGRLGGKVPEGARPRDGADAPLRLDDLRVRPARARQHLLRPDHAGARTRRLGFALLRLGPVRPGHVPDLRVRLPGAEGQVDSKAREGGGARLLRPDRAGLRLEPRRDAHRREKGRRFLRDQRGQGLDHQRLDRRRGRRLGQARRRRARLPGGEGNQRVLDVRAQSRQRTFCRASRA
jgi:hypothetical protein